MRMKKLIGNAAIVIGGSILMIGGMIAVAVLFLGATLIVLLRKLNPRRARAELTGTGKAV
jgi:hypothetical protein